MGFLLPRSKIVADEIVVVVMKAVAVQLGERQPEFNDALHHGRVLRHGGGWV